MTNIQWTTPLTLGAPALSAFQVPGVIGGPLPLWPGAAVVAVQGGFHVTAPSDSAKGFAVDVPITGGLAEMLAHTDGRTVRIVATLNGQPAHVGTSFAKAAFADSTTGALLNIPPQANQFCMVPSITVPTGPSTVESTGIEVTEVKAVLDAHPSPMLRMEFTSQGAAAVDVIVTGFTAQILDAAGPPPTPPAAVRYRDPADGQFKPLSQIAARGYPAAPSGPQPPAGPPLGTWDWTTTKQQVPGAASGAAVTNSSGQGALYINAVDANGTDHTDALTAAAYDSPVTVVQGDVIVSGLIRSAYSITNGFQVRWTTVGPWALSAGPVDIWLAAP